MFRVVARSLPAGGCRGWPHGSGFVAGLWAGSALRRRCGFRRGPTAWASEFAIEFDVDVSQFQPHPAYLLIGRTTSTKRHKPMDQAAE